MTTGFEQLIVNIEIPIKVPAKLNREREREV
jgi:hypothetical protein